MAVQLPKKSSALPWPALVPLGHHAGKPPISLQKMVMLVGSRHNAHLHLMSRHVSKAHALILSYGGSVYIRDLASREHVYINGAKQREAWLRNGDLIKIGSFTFKFKAGPPKVVAGADEPTDHVDLEIDGAEAPLSVAEKVMLIGRRPTCDVSLTEDSVSTAHAVIFHVGGKRYLRDLGSRTGTFVNGKKIHQQELNAGDELRIGETNLRYVLAEAHEHHIEPVEVGGSDAGDVDELEHLVGTAPLDMAAEMRAHAVPSDDEALERDLHAVVGGEAAADDELKPDDLIELEFTPDEAVARGGRGAAAVDDEPIAIEPDELSVTAPADAGGARGGVSATPAAEPEVQEIDLSSDPDVADLPQSAAAADTRAIGMSMEPPPKPTLSERVVDELPVGDAGAADDEVDFADLLPLEEERAAATPPVASGAGDGHDEVISPRGGWQGMSRVEDDTLAGELDSPLPVVGEAAGTPELSGADAAPVVEEEALVDWAPVETPAVEGAESVEATAAAEGQGEAASEDDLLSILGDEGETTAEGDLPVIEPVVESIDAESPAMHETPADETRALDLSVAETVLEPEADQASVTAEPEQSVAEVSFEPSVVAPPEEIAESRTVTEPVAPIEPEASPVEPTVAETPVEPVIVDVAAGEAPAVIEEPVSAESVVADTPVIEEMPPVEPEAFVAPVVEPEPEAFVAPVVEPEPAENFGKKGRARKGGKAKGEKKVVVAPVVKEKPAKGKGGRKPRKGVAAAAAAAAAEAAEVAEDESVGAAGIAVGAGIVGAAIVADKVGGEETNVVAAEQGATADAAGDVAAVAEQGAEVQVAPVEEIAATVPVVDVESVVGAVVPETVEESSVTPLAMAEVETSIEGEAAREADVVPVSEADAAEIAFVTEIEGEGAAMAAAAAEEPLAGDVSEILAAEPEMAPVEAPKPEDVTPFEVPAESVQSIGEAGVAIEAPIEPLDLNESEATWSPGAVEDTAGAAEDLSDSAFGRQMEAFTETSSGDIVEEPVDDVEDADEALAIALSGTGDEVEDNTNVTAGGIEPLAAQQFEANGESVELDTPGLAEADAVLGGQAFVAEADEAHDLRTSATEEMGSQSFDAQAAADEVKEVAPRPEPVAPPQQPAQSVGGTGGFVIGTDLSSFIGGMPLVLPDLPPAPTGFGQVQVSFAGAKAPWQQAQRPAFPMGKSLAQEVMDAAEGLRDVEKMDADLAVQEDQAAGEELGEESYTDDGAPGDEWNVAAVLEDEDEPVSAEWHPAEHTGEASMTGVSSAATSVAATEADAELEAGELSEEALVDEAQVGEAPGAGNDDMLQEIELSGGFGVADRDEDLAARPLVDDELTEAQLLEITADQGALPEALPAEPSVTEGEDAASGFEVEASAGDDFQEITVDELAFDEPAEGSVADATRAVGEDVGLDFDVAAPAEAEEEVESVVDRSPPPPLAPLPPTPKKGGGKTVVPPPPPPPPPAAKGGGRARGGEVPRSLTGAAPEDAIFGSLEHGKVGGEAAFGTAGGVREVDVFATPSPEVEDEVEGFGGGELAKARPEPGNGEAGHAPPTARRATRVIVPPKMDALGGAPVTALSRGGGGGNRALARPGLGDGRKKSAAGRVTWIVLLMLISMGLAVGGIFYFLKVKQQSIGELHFQNVGALTKKQRNDLRQEQYDYLMTPNVRMTARGYVQAKGLPLGFLEAGEGEAERIARVHPGGLDDRTPATMTVEYAGTDPLDKVRVHALLMAVYQENSSKVNESLRLNSEIGKLDAKLKEYQQVRDRRDALKQIVDAAPSPETMAQLDAAVKQADAAYDSATQAVKEAQLDVRRAEEQLPGSPGEALLKTAGDGGNKATPADKELADLQKALEDAASRTAELKGAASAEADAKRKLLDQAVEAFQQTAAGLMRQNPQLAQYVQAVQQLQERTHKLGGDLIEVQQQQHKRLSALKKDMDEQVLARRQEIWAADKGLADLRAQLDLANRKYNAARDQGFTEDSREVRDALSEIKDLSARTDARKNELGKDPIVTKVAGALQELITITKERLDADRARIEKDIKDQEQAFAESGMIERLPAQQQAEAKALDEKQRAISDLRKQYADALDRRTAESNAALRDLDAEVTTIRGKIDERKRMLAQEGAKNLTQQQEAERRQLLERKQAALKKADDQLATAQRVYMDRNKALRNAKVALNEGTTARQEFEAIEQTLPAKDQEAQYAKLDLDERRDKLQKIVKVEEPKESDVRVSQGRDDRMMYSLGAVMGLAVLFGVFAVFSVAGGEGRAARREMDEFEEDDGFEGGPMAIHEIGAREEEEAGHARY